MNKQFWNTFRIIHAMFEATTEIALENPVTVIALLPALYLTVSALLRVRKLLASTVTIITAIGLFPVFLLFVVGEFTGSSVWMSMGTRVFQFEASIAAGIARVYDGLLAAWLRVFTLVIDSLLSINVFPAETGAGTGATPLSTLLSVWVSVFVLHVAGGVLLVYGLYRGRGTTSTDSLLRGGGVAFLVAGLFVMVLQGHVEAFNTAVTGVLLMAVVGLEIGVVAVLLGVKPDFSSTDSNDDFDDVRSAIKEVRDSLVSRFEMYVERRESEMNERDS